MEKQTTVPFSRRIEIGFAAFAACLLVWGLIQPLVGERLDVAFLLVAGALFLNALADLVRNMTIRYSMMAIAMVLIIAFFIQR